MNRSEPNHNIRMFSKTASVLIYSLAYLFFLDAFLLILLIEKWYTQQAGCFLNMKKWLQTCLMWRNIVEFIKWGGIYLPFLTKVMSISAKLSHLKNVRRKNKLIFSLQSSQSFSKYGQQSEYQDRNTADKHTHHWQPWLSASVCVGGQGQLIMGEIEDGMMWQGFGSSLR